MVELVSGSPLNAVMSAGASDSNLGLFGGRQRPNAIGDPNTDGSDTERVVFEGNEDARYFDSAAFANPGVGTYGNAPRTNGDARYQFRKNVDLVIAKDTTIFGNHVGQVRFEILNLTNTVKFRGFSGANNAIDSTGFGRDRRAGRVHADLAAQLPLHLLIRGWGLGGWGLGLPPRRDHGAAFRGRPVSLYGLLSAPLRAPTGGA